MLTPIEDGDPTSARLAAEEMSRSAACWIDSSLQINGGKVGGIDPLEVVRKKKSNSPHSRTLLRFQYVHLIIGL